MYKVIAAASVVLWSSTASAATCRMGKWQSIPNQLTFAQMTVSSGRSCTTGQGFRIASPNTFRAMKITTRPLHGTASTSGHLITYRSAPGYVGSDTFVFTVYGTQAGGSPRVAPVQVSVTVN
jgi:hypothetical protein